MYINKRWIILDSNSATENIYKNINFSPIIYKILKNRGITGEDNIENFLNSDIKQMNDSFLLPDMRESVELIKEYINLNKKITIYGDYDADGVTSTSMLYNCLKKLGVNIDYYIPNRINEGYGLNIDALEKIISSGTNLIITVDCGISSIDEVEYCKNSGICIIITDHHECKEIIPATLVINPKRYECKYPFRDLAGAGVTFKLIQGLQTVFDSIEPYEYIGLAAIGTTADIVPLINENRIIVKEGLKTLVKTQNLGIKSLLEATSLSSEIITSDNISFIIAPRINAIGRIGNAKDAVELFTTSNQVRASELSLKLNEENKKRQSIEDEIFIQANEMIQSKGNVEDNYAIVLCSDKWHIGVVGIVASKIVEKYFRPVILLCKNGNICKGSGRSIPGFNMFEALCNCSDLLVKYGGHEQAAGMSLLYENLDIFRDRFNILSKEAIEQNNLRPTINADCEIMENDIDLKLLEELKMLEPFGMGNPHPLFIYNCTNIKEIRPVGINDKHLKLKISGKEKVLDAIAFNMGYKLINYQKNESIDILFSIDKNIWNGNENVQLIAKDIRHCFWGEIEKEYYRNFIKSFNKLNLKNTYKPSNYNELNIECIKFSDDFFKEKKIDGSLFLINSLPSLKKFFRYFDEQEILFQNNLDSSINKRYLIICPNYSDIDFEGINDVYIMDNLIDLSYINNNFVKNNKAIKWHVFASDIDNDILFINSILPKREQLKKIFLFLKKHSEHGKYETTLKGLSNILSLNQLLVYFCIRALNELNILSFSYINNENILIKFNDYSRTNIDNSEIIKKIDSINQYLNALKSIQ